MKTEGLSALLFLDSRPVVYPDAKLAHSSNPIVKLFAASRNETLLKENTPDARQKPISGLRGSGRPDLNTTRGWDLGTLSPDAMKFVEGPPYIPELMMKTVLAQARHMSRPRQRILNVFRFARADVLYNDFQLSLLGRYQELMKPVVAQSDVEGADRLRALLDRPVNQDELSDLHDEIRDQKLRTCISSLFCCLRDLPILAGTHLKAVGVENVAEETLNTIRTYIHATNSQFL